MRSSPRSRAPRSASGTNRLRGLKLIGREEEEYGWWANPVASNSAGLAATKAWGLAGRAAERCRRAAAQPPVVEFTQYSARRNSIGGIGSSVPGARSRRPRERPLRVRLADQDGVGGEGMPGGTEPANAARTGAVEPRRRPAPDLTRRPFRTAARASPAGLARSRSTSSRRGAAAGRCRPGRLSPISARRPRSRTSAQPATDGAEPAPPPACQAAGRRAADSGPGAVRSKFMPEPCSPWRAWPAARMGPSRRWSTPRARSRRSRPAQRPRSDRARMLRQHLHAHRVDPAPSACRACGVPAAAARLTQSAVPRLAHRPSSPWWTAAVEPEPQRRGRGRRSARC